MLWLGSLFIKSVVPTKSWKRVSKFGLNLLLYWFSNTKLGNSYFRYQEYWPRTLTLALSKYCLYFYFFQRASDLRKAQKARLLACLLTLLRMMMPSWLWSLVVMSNMAPPSPGTMVYSTSAFFPMSKSWALILPTAEPTAEDSGTLRWKKPVNKADITRDLLSSLGVGSGKRETIWTVFHVASCRLWHLQASSWLAAIWSWGLQLHAWHSSIMICLDIKAVQLLVIGRLNL